MGRGANAVAEMMLMDGSSCDGGVSETMPTAVDGARGAEHRLSLGVRMMDEGLVFEDDDDNDFSHAKIVVDI